MHAFTVRAALFAAVAVAATALTGGPAAAASTYDYPTVDRIEYVHMCQREHADKPPQEMLYKCSCIIDKIANELNYEDYVEASTAFYASSIAGERGQVIRNERVAKTLADQFKEALGKSKKACFVN